MRGPLPTRRDRLPGFRGQAALARAGRGPAPRHAGGPGRPRDGGHAAGAGPAEAARDRDPVRGARSRRTRSGTRASGGLRSRSESGLIAGAAADRCWTIRRRWSEVEPSLEARRGLAGRRARDEEPCVITDEAAVAVWRACQVPGVRAASAVEPADVSPGGAQPGGEPAAWSSRRASRSRWIRQLAATFRHGGAPGFREPIAGGGGADEDRRGDRPRHAVAVRTRACKGGRFLIALPMPLRGPGRRLAGAARKWSSTTTWGPAPAP